MRRLIAAAAVLAASITGAAAQSSPGLVTGQVPTAAQWNSYFAAKQDVLGYTPLNVAGGTMTGRLITAASAAGGSGFRLPAGAAPSTPTDGDVWVTTAGMFVRANGVTVGPLVDASGSGVDSVTAGDSSLTISPTAGNVVASINLANINTWQISQAITLSGNTPVGWTITNANAGTSALATDTFSNGTGTGRIGIGGTGYTGIALLQNRAFITADAATAGIAINTENASDPIVLGTASTERARVLLGLMVGTTTDPGAGIINVLTGIRVNNAATAGNVLRGDGTNFVASTLACGDLSNSTAGCSNAIASASEIAAATANRTVDAAGLNASGALVTLTDAATVAVDMATGINFTLTLGGNRTLGAPTNTQAGRSGCIFLVQDGTGSRTLAYNAVWKFANGVDPTLTTTAGAVDMLCYIVRDASNIMATITLNMG